MEIWLGKLPWVSVLVQPHKSIAAILIHLIVDQFPVEDYTCGKYSTITDIPITVRGSDIAEDPSTLEIEQV